MNTKGTKFLAVIAGMAFALAGFIVLGAQAEQSDATSDIEASAITVAATEYTVYLDPTGDTDTTLEIPVAVTLVSAAAAGDFAIIYTTSSDTTKATVSANYKSAALAVADTSATVNVTFASVLAAGDTTLTIYNKSTPAASNVVIPITIHVKTPTLTVVSEVHKEGLTAITVDAVMTGNAGQTFKVSTSSEITNWTITTSATATSDVITIGTTVGNKNTFTITPEASAVIGVYSITINAIYGTTGASISSPKVDLFVYDTEANAKVIGYAKTGASGADSGNQIIFYSDGSAVVKLKDGVSPNVSAKVTYDNASENGTFNVDDKHDSVFVGGEEYLYLDLQGFVNPADITKTQVKLTSHYAAADAGDIATFTGAPYVVFLQANDVGAFYPDSEQTFKIDSAAMVLKKNDTLTNSLIAPGGASLYTSMSFEVAPKEFLGYNGNATTTDLGNLVLPNGSMKVEAFIFNLITKDDADADSDGNDDHQAFAKWNGIFQIYVYDGTVIGGSDTKEQVTALYHQDGAAGVTLINKTPGSSSAAGGHYKVYTQTLAQAGDLLIVQITNNDAAHQVKYSLSFNVANVDKSTGTTYVSAGDAISTISVQMLTNGVFAIKGIGSSVIINVTVTDSDAKLGFFFGVEDVDNDASQHGTAVARLDSYDTITVASAITMSGTYYKEMDFNSEDVIVYGNIANKIASGEITYAGTVDNVNAGSIGASGLATSADHNVYRLVMSSDTLGFYAVQAHYNSIDTEFVIGSTTTA